jgi:hypothetical protein
VIPASWLLRDGGLVLRGHAIAVGSTGALVLVILASLAAVVMAGVQSTVLGRAHRAAQHKLVAQAWQLRQLLPIQPR